MEEKKVIPVDFSDLTANVTYTAEVLGQVRRINSYAPKAITSGNGLDKHELLAMKDMIHKLHVLLLPSALDKKKYKKKFIDEENKLNEDWLKNPDKRHLYLKQLNEWLALATDQFGVAGILPALDEELDMATDEQEELEEKERIEKEVKKTIKQLIQDNKLDEYIEEIKRSMQKKVKKTAEERFIENASDKESARKFQELSKKSYEELEVMENATQSANTTRPEK